MRTKTSRWAVPRMTKKKPEVTKPKVRRVQNLFYLLESEKSATEDELKALRVFRKHLCWSISLTDVVPIVLF
jgi:hypothetical protein